MKKTKQLYKSIIEYERVFLCIEFVPYEQEVLKKKKVKMIGTFLANSQDWMQEVILEKCPLRGSYVKYFAPWTVK